jgi:hypothetical protein
MAAVCLTTREYFGVETMDCAAKANERQNIEKVEKENRYGAYRIENGEAKFSEAGASEMLVRMGLAKQ